MRKMYVRAEMEENKLEPGKNCNASCGRKEWMIKHQYISSQVNL